jgi:hypothetical protein
MVHTTKPKIKAGSISFAINGKPVSAHEFRETVEETFKEFPPIHAKEVEFAEDEKGRMRWKTKKRLF